MVYFTKRSKPSRLKVIVPVILVLLGFVYFPAAVYSDPLGDQAISQATVLPENLPDHKLVPDSEKVHRLHSRKHGAKATAPPSIIPQNLQKLQTSVPQASAYKSVAQKDNLRALVSPSDAQARARVAYNKRNGTPRIIQLENTGPTRATKGLAGSSLGNEEASLQFLNANRALLQIDTPQEEFQAQKSWTDSIGSHHIRYQQYYQGLPVWGKEAMVHLDASNAVYMFQGRYEPTPQGPERVFSITEDQAVQVVLNHLNYAGPSAEVVLGIDQVWYTCATGKMVTAYAIDVQTSLLQRWLYLIDANSSAVLQRISGVNDETVSVTGTDLNGVTQSFRAWRKPDGGLVSADLTIPLNDSPPSHMPAEEIGSTYILDYKNQTEGTSLYFFNGPDWDPTAVSMSHHISIIDEYYKTTFNRQGIDDANKSNMLVGHLGENHANASWNGQFIVFGDGDGVEFTNLAGSLDVTAHEYTHGVVEFTAGLIYQNQSGALNEAYADIMACMVDRDDWVVGEDITIPAPGYLRNLANPADGLDPLPTKMSEYKNLPIDQDFGGVHVNCGIPSRAGYLIAEGLTVEGLGTSLGRDKTEQIFYRALLHYLTQGSNFADARDATIQAAQDLYGAQDAASVQAAWDAVEVFGDQSPADEPTPTDPVSGDDVMVYLRPVDSSGEAFDLYVQFLANPFNGYDMSTDYGPFNTAISAAYMRPSAITLGDETGIFYVGIDNNLYMVMPDGSNMPITDNGTVHSMAISPDGKYIAVTMQDEGDNAIYIGNLDSDSSMDRHVLISPSTAPGDVGMQNTILYADSLSFDYTSRILVFDAYNEINIAGDVYSYWTIGCLDLNTGELFWPFAYQNPNYDIGNASFATNNSFVIAFDVLDYTTDPVTPWVWTMDLSTQTIQTVANVNPKGYYFDDLVCGAPSFWGDDDAITMQVFLPGYGSQAYKIPLENWAGRPDQAVLLNDNELTKPFMHRRGTRRLVAEINTDTQACSFINGKEQSQVALSNKGNRDIQIYSITITGPGAASFRHTGVNGLLPQNTEKNIQVFFDPPPGVQGTQAATLVILSDADIPTMEISLTGTADPDGPIGPGDGPGEDPGEDPGDDPGDGGDTDGGGGGGSSSGGGGGCFIATLKP